MFRFESEWTEFDNGRATVLVRAFVGDRDVHRVVEGVRDEEPVVREYVEECVKRRLLDVLAKHFRFLLEISSFQLPPAWTQEAAAWIGKEGIQVKNVEEEIGVIDFHSSEDFVRAVRSLLAAWEALLISP